MGACARPRAGYTRSYAVLQGVDRILPEVDVYLGRLPAASGRQLLDALIKFTK